MTARLYTGPNPDNPETVDIYFQGMTLLEFELMFSTFGIEVFENHIKEAKEVGKSQVPL